MLNQHQHQPPSSYLPYTPSTYLHQRQPTRASQHSAPPFSLSSSSSCSGGGVGGGGGSSVFAGSPQQHSASSSYTSSYAHNLPSFESSFGMLSASRCSTSFQSPTASTSLPVVSSLASRTVPVSLCKPPVLLASSTAVRHHHHHPHDESQAYPPAPPSRPPPLPSPPPPPPPPQRQPATAATSIMDTSLVSCLDLKARILALTIARN
ncbi:unnamed protein product [Mesocestoides corti]|uniref:OAR domain-containing protein n=1 Tax=Mesocestoides corti TaxID=53468 RepID=A0A0R3URN3_MESCO|nr:unnamed protein product [Mesocestoides corti]